MSDRLAMGGQVRRARARADRGCRRVLLAAAMLWCAAQPAGAQSGADLGDLSLEDLMQVKVETVTGASKYRQLVTEAPASVTIITSDEIREHHYRSIADVLRTVRGFYVTSDRNYQYVGTRGFIRPGDYNSRLLVLIDGHRLNDSIFGGALIGQEFPVDVDLIERVEVIRGPGSALYGSSAMFGVVNVITKLGHQLPGVQVSALGGGQQTTGTTLSYGHVRRQGGSVLVASTVYRSNGLSDIFFPEYVDDTATRGYAREVDRTRRVNGLVNVTRGGLAVQGLFGVREKRVPTAAFGAAFNDPRTRTVDGQGFVDATYVRGWQNGLELNGRLSIDHYDFHGYTAYDVPGGTVLNHDEAHGNWWTSEVRLSRRVRRHRLTGGFEFRDNFQQAQHNFDESPYALYLDDARDSDVLSLFAQDEWRIGGRVIVEAGVRQDVYDDVGRQTNPRAALIFNLTPATTLKALYGRAFRAPTVYELFWQQADVSRPNPDLRPERMTTSEIALERYMGATWRLAMNGFVYRVSDLVNQTADDEDGRLVYRNLDAVDAEGLELEVEGRWRRGMQLRVSQTLQRSRNRRLDERLTNSPASLVQVTARAPLGSTGAIAALDLQGMSRRRTLLGPDAPGYVVANLTATLPRVAPRVDLSLGVWNVLGARYGDPGSEEHRQIVIPQDGRVFGLKARVRL